VTPEELAEEYGLDQGTDRSTAGDDISADDDKAGGDGSSGLDLSDYAPAPDPTPLGFDSDTRVGMLDNGLTYYLRENDNPGSSIELRLVVHAGSVQQEVGDSGVAHFLEHMLFNGTDEFPGNELKDALESLGIQFGPELNAFTTFDETVYELWAQTDTEASLDTAIQVLAQWASAATIDPAEVSAERGVVRDELRQRTESADGQIFVDLIDIYTEGTGYQGASPIGTAEWAETMEEAPLRAFYDRWYRPDNMAVIIVGDVPVDVLEEKLVDAFDEISARGDDHPTRSPVTPTISSDPIAEIITHPENVADNLSIDFPLTAWDQGTVGGSKLTIWETLIADILTRRLTSAWFDGALASDGEPYVDEFSLNRGLRFYGSNIRSSDLEASLAQYLGILRGAADSGFTDEEVADAVAEFGAGLDSWEASLGSTQDGSYAWWYTNHFLTGIWGEGEQSWIDRERGVIGSVTTEELSAHWRWTLARGGPIIAAIGADASTLPAIDSMLDIAENTVGSVTTGAFEAIDALMDAPVAVEPTDSYTVLEDAQVWQFENGASVVFQHTEIVEGSVSFEAGSLGGYSALRNVSFAQAVLASNAVAGSGVGPHSPAQLDQFLSDKSIGVGPYIFTEGEGFSGGGAVEDIETLFQLYHLMMTAPRIDETAFRSAIAEGQISIDQVAADAATEAELELWFLSYRPEFNSWVPTQAELDAATPDSLLEIFTSRFGRVDDLVISIAGDADVDVIERLANTYVGTLPAGPDDSFANQLAPARTEVAAIEIPLRGDAANGGIAWHFDSRAEWDLDDAMTARVLETLIQTLIIDSPREDLGASYGGSALITPWPIPVERLELTIRVNGDPDRIDEIRSAVFAGLTDLVEAGPSSDAFDRAVAVLRADYGFVSNNTFTEQNSSAVSGLDDGAVTTVNRNRELDEVTIADVRRLAARLIDFDTYGEVARVPA
jgi:zinc protease